MPRQGREQAGPVNAAAVLGPTPLKRIGRAPKIALTYH